MSHKNREWFRNNAVNIVIALLISLIGWGGNEAVQFFKEKIIKFETWRIEDIRSDAALEGRVTTLEYMVGIKSTETEK